MRHVLRSVLLAFLVFGLTGAVAAAERQVTVKSLDTTVPTTLLLGLATAYQACQMGNLNPPAWAVPGFLSPPEDYKLAFDPVLTCAVCPVGFNVFTVHVDLQTGGGCTIVMEVDVEEAIYPTNPNCPEPGPVMCTSGLFQVSIPNAGLWDIGLPITCDCLTMGKTYLLSAHFESADCAPDLVTDAGPAMLCLNWNNFGTGWYDLLAAYSNWPGQLKFWADAECCSAPVPVEGKTWGAIKDIYEE